MEKSPLTTPTMTTIAGRPIKILHVPSGDILVACRTASGEDVHVPASALIELFATEIVNRVNKTRESR